MPIPPKPQQLPLPKQVLWTSSTRLAVSTSVIVSRCKISNKTETKKTRIIKDTKNKERIRKLPLYSIRLVLVGYKAQTFLKVVVLSSISWTSNKVFVANSNFTWMVTNLFETNKYYFKVFYLFINFELTCII